MEGMGGVIWMLKIIIRCLMLALFGCLCQAFPCLLTRSSTHHFLVSLL